MVRISHIVQEKSMHGLMDQYKQEQITQIVPIIMWNIHNQIQGILLNLEYAKLLKNMGNLMVDRGKAL